ncbi:MAG TPA: peptidoglycan editing factor PgeF [Clostridia bacterium]|nr:peptidoglycan editing factor PgeF [Clostridia bacterium]
MEYDIVTENKIKYIKFKKLGNMPFIKHGFSTRHGGISKGVYKYLNLGFKTEDEPNNVKENIRKFALAVGVNYENLVMSDQVHGDTIKIVNSRNKGESFPEQKGHKGIDGLITDIPDVPLMAIFADCVPIFFVDTVKKVVGLGHSGWKGTKLKIGRKMAQTMMDVYGSEPGEITAVIGPSIGRCCYEVDKTVIEQFNRAFKDTSTFVEVSKASSDRLSCYGNRASNLRYRLDLWEANRIALNEAGILNKNIVISNLCTGCNPDLFYSHRKEKGNTGRMGALIQLV